MNKYLYITIALIGMSSCSKEVLTSQWQKTEYQGDNEMPRTSYTLDDKSQLLYLVTNDDENIYLNLKVSDQTAIRQILDFGFTVWIDRNGKNKKELGITYPMQRERGGMGQRPGGDRNMQNNERSGNRQGGRDENRRGPQLDEEQKIELLGFADDDVTFIIASDEEKHINGNMSFNRYRELEYQLVIPFNRIGMTDPQGKIVSINAESGEPQQSNGQGGPGGGGFGGGPGGGGPGGGGPGGGGQGGFGGGPGGGGPGGQGGGPGQGSTNSIRLKLKHIQLVGA